MAWLLLIKQYKQGFVYRSDISKHIDYLLNLQPAPQAAPTRGPADDYAELDTILSRNKSFVVKKL